MPYLFLKMETRRLHNPDMKQLVLVLRTEPHSTVGPGDERFQKATQAAIKKLPRRLRSSAVSRHGSLCLSHKGLDAHLINDIWSWIKYELEVGIGRFLFPIIMFNKLHDEVETRVRQLEPVVRMFSPEWTLVESAAPGKQPIDTGDKWARQENGCPACMLARLGSDHKVLFALYACMYGRLRSTSGGQRGVKAVRSKRLRFVRYWMKTHSNGTQAAEEAYDLGVQLKTVRRESKYAPRCSTQNARDSLDQSPATPRRRLDHQNLAAVNISVPFHPDGTAYLELDRKAGHVPTPNPTTLTVMDLKVTLADIQGRNINVQPPTPTPRMSIPPMPFTQPTSPQTPAPRCRDYVFSTTSTPQPRPASSVYLVQNPSVTTLRVPRPASYAYSMNDPY